MGAMSSTSDAPVLPADLTDAIDRAGYYPALVADVVAAALVREPIENHLVHLETTFDRDVVRRHITVLVLTPTRLLIAHADDHADEPPAPQDVATATTESIPLSAVRGVMLTHVVENPSTYVPGSLGREISLTLGWGTVARARPRAGRRAPTPTATPTTATRAPSPATTSRCASPPPPTATTPSPQALGFARDLSAAIGQG